MSNVSLRLVAAVSAAALCLAQALPASAEPLLNPADKIADGMKTQSQLMARAMEAGVSQDEKLGVINDILRLEESLLKETRLEKNLEAAKTESDRERVLREFRSDETFRLSEVRFTGNASVPSKELRRPFEELLGRDVAAPALQGAVDGVKKIYREKGYLSTYVYLPKQDARAGTLEVAVVEGRLGELTVTGNKFHSEKAIKSHFDAKPGEILKYSNFEHDLEALNRSRDLKANVVLKPGAAPGTTDVELKVRDKRPFHASVDMNNLGTRNTGQYRYGTTLSHTNLTGRLDPLTARVQRGRDAFALSADYNAPVNRHGTRLGGSLTYAENEVGGDFEVLGIEGDATVYSAYATHPILDRPGFRTDARAGFDWKSVENRVLGVVSGEDELRVPHAGLVIDQSDALGRTYSPHSLHFGLDAFGATTDDSARSTTLGAGGEFFVYRGTLIRHHRLTQKISLLLRGTGQWTSDSLPPSEQLRLGGAYSVRGFQEGEYLGDYGMHGGLELIVPVDVLFKPFPDSWTFPFTGQPLNRSIEFVAFLDGGFAGSSTPVLGEEERRYLAGGGAGFRVRVHEKFYARFEWAGPLGGDRPTDSRNSAFYFGISVDLF